jgi:hypothetical protein
VGRIEISGGEFERISSKRGAAIGAGYAALAVSIVEYIEIEGGFGTVEGVGQGAAIGAGYAEDGGDSRVTTVLLSGGVFDAFGDEGAGIGAGAVGTGLSYVQELTIVGGSWLAKSANGAGIGAGYASLAAGASLVSTLDCWGGSISAQSEWAAGIGAGNGEAGGESAVEIISFVGTIVTAKGGNGAGIGAGYAEDGETIVWTIEVKSGSITATSERGSGIGAGCADGGSTFVDRIVIEGDAVWASSELGAGIGAGSSENGSVSASSVAIQAGSVTASGSPAVSCDMLTLGSAERVLQIDLPTRESAAMVAIFVECHEGTVRAITVARRFFAPSSRATLRDADFIGQYRGDSVGEPLRSDTICAHFAKLPPFNRIPVLRFRNVDTGFTKTASFNGYPEQGLIVSLPSTGDYVVEIASEPGMILAYEGSDLFQLNDGDNFFGGQVVITSISPTPDSDGLPVSAGLIAAIAAASVGLVMLGVAVTVVNRRHARKRAPPPKPEPPAPETLIGSTRTQGLLDEGIEMNELPGDPASPAEARPEFREVPPEEPVALAFPVDPSFTPDFPEDM